LQRAAAQGSGASRTSCRWVLSFSFSRMGLFFLPNPHRLGRSAIATLRNGILFFIKTEKESGNGHHPFLTLLAK
jgi:hypothetical protein